MPDSDPLLKLFPLVFLVWAIFIFWQFRRRYVAMKETGVQFPPLDTVTVAFRERGASGRSLLNMYTKLGGARNVLEVVVTNAELWIRTPFPFSLIAQGFDGLHRVPIGSVDVRSRRRRSVTIAFPRHDGDIVGFELRLKNPEDFVAAVEAVQTAS